MCSWNVGSLTGRSLEVAEKLAKHKIDVACLQETRWKGGSTRFVGAKGSRYKLYWKGEDGYGGLGIAVKEAFPDKVIEVKRCSDIVLVLVMIVGTTAIRLISAYAPQVGRSDREQEAFL
jgi:exonuclease III